MIVGRISGIFSFVVIFVLKRKSKRRIFAELSNFLELDSNRHNLFAVDFTKVETIVKELYENCCRV